MKFYQYALIAAAVSMPVVQTFADPVVDGTFDAANYASIVNDTPSETTEQFYNTGLDINRIGFTLTPSTVYIGLETVQPIAHTGDPTTIGRRSVTGFWIDIATTTSTHYYIETYTNTAGSIDYAELYQSPTGAPGSYTYVADATSAAIGSALELSFNTTDLPLPAQFSFNAQLDGSGSWDDDQISGTHTNVPEPATMALFAAGTAMIVSHRRKKHA